MRQRKIDVFSAGKIEQISNWSIKTKQFGDQNVENVVKRESIQLAQLRDDEL